MVRVFTSIQSTQEKVIGYSSIIENLNQNEWDYSIKLCYKFSSWIDWVEVDWTPEVLVSGSRQKERRRNTGQAKALLTFKVKEKVWPLLKLCASEHF